MSADDSAGTASMSATNGEVNNTSTPDPPALATPGKRKRVSSHDDKAPSQDANPAVSQAQERAKLQENLRNLVDILSKNDVELQLLSCPLPTSPAKPRSKRAKVSGDREEVVSIQTRVTSDRYNSLSEFLSDIERASAAVIERNKAMAAIAGSENDGSALSETVNRIAAFKKVLNSLVRQAQVSQSTIKAEASEDDTEAPAKTPPSNVEPRTESMVLTLFGNPANPKQLYSSLQKSVKVPLPSDDPATEEYVEVQAPLPEVGLPNGITATKAAPYNLESKPKEPKRTFGEVFGPRQPLPQLEPPRGTRSSSRGINGWIDNFEAITNYKAFLGDRNNYCLAPLPSGQWIQYGGVTSSPSYWNRRQKQQSQQPAQDRFEEDHAQWADEDAPVLQGVYSSFAPSFDSSGAIVQADSKDLVWWNRRGAKRLHTLVTLPYQDEEVAQPGNIGELDESTLEEMVKSFNPEDFADNVSHDDASKPEDKDEGAQELDEVLREISDLLETLSSYQKIRNLEPASGQEAEPKETDADSEKPEDYSSAEHGVYETLKSSLAALISNLPPYAVAKLNGDQLDELNLSQKVVVENPDYHGTMEKDDFTIQQERAAAVAPMQGGANRTPSRSGSYPAGYSQRQFVPNPRMQQPQGGFQASPYYGQRQPSASGPTPFTPGAPQHYAQQARPPTTPSQRPGYLPGYTQPTPQFQQAQFQRPGPNGYTPYGAQQGPPHASPQPYTPRPGQPGFNPAAAYGAGRSTSPQKPPSYAAPRTPYMTPGSTNPQQRYMQQQPQQQPPPYANYPSNQAQPPSGYSNSAAATIYARSAAEQAALMDRNKAQLAAHRASRQSSTPQPTDSSQGRSVTPNSKQNGTPMA